MNYKHSIFIFFLQVAGFCCNAQNKAIILEFTHQTDTPVAFPNYFEDTEWTQHVVGHVKNWVSATFKASVVDVRKKNPITFVPYQVLQNTPLSITKTDYNLAIGIHSSLVSGLTSSKLAPHEGRLRMEVAVYNDRQKKIFKNKIKVDFTIIKDTSFYQEAWLSKEEFQEFYFHCVKMALRQDFIKKGYTFQQMPQKEYKLFVQQAHRLELKRRNRGRFEVLGEVPEVIELKFSAPSQREKEYSRVATVENTINQKSYRIKAILKSNYHPVDVKVYFSQKQQSIGVLQGDKTLEVTQLYGEIQGDDLVFTRNLDSQFVKIESNGVLWAMMDHKGGRIEDSARYLLYLLPSLTQMQKAKVLDLLMAETAYNAIIKYYEIETK